MHPFLLQGKKRYAAVKFEGNMDKGKVSYSGLEVVRRDNCPLLKTIQTDFFKHLLEDIDPNGAATSLLNHIQNLMAGKVSFEDLTISKNLSKLKYAGNQIHVSLNERIRARTPALAYSVGSRIPYVVVTGRGELYERGEDPVYAKEHCYPIDKNYYFQKQIVGPMMRLMTPLFGFANAKLFFERSRGTGLHTHFSTSHSNWIPPILGDTDTAIREIKKKVKRDPDVQTSTLHSFFKPSKK